MLARLSAYILLLGLACQFGHAQRSGGTFSILSESTGPLVADGNTTTGFSQLGATEAIQGTFSSATTGFTGTIGFLSQQNSAPKDLNTTAQLTIAENQPIGTIVGEFNATDPDVNATLTYSLVSGAGDGNNSLFTLESDGTLKTATTFDYESNASTYSIRVQVRDGHNATGEGNFTVALTDILESSPNMWGLANDLNNDWKNIPWFGSYFDKNVSWIYHDTLGWAYQGSTDGNETWLYHNELGWMWTEASLYPFVYSAVKSNWLYINNSAGNASYYDYQSSSWISFSGGPGLGTSPQVWSGSTSYSNGALVRSGVNTYVATQTSTAVSPPNVAYWTDLGVAISALSVPVESVPTIAKATLLNSLPSSAPNTNAPPADLNSTAPLTIAENQPIGTTVGEFNATDLDANSTLIYHLVSGAGDGNNSLFTLETNGTLKTATTFDFETNASTYTIRVQAKDEYNATVEGNFTVTLTDVYETTYLGINDGLALYYSFEETDGSTVSDRSTNLRNANLIDGNLNTSGKFGSGVVFNNSAHAKIDLGVNQLALPNNWTISTWFTTPFDDTFVDFRHALTSGGTNAHVVFDQAGSKVLGVFNGTFSSTGYSLTNLASGWHHIVASGSGEQTSLWIDGVAVGTVNAKVVSAVEIIGNLSGGFGRFTDKLDEFRIYNRAISETEVSILYGGGNGDFFSYDINLSNQIVMENTSLGTTIGVINPTSFLHAPYQFSLVAGQGDTHNSMFQLDTNGTLKTIGSIDFEANSNLSFRVNVHDSENRNLEKYFIIQVNDVFENISPSDINSTAPLTISENQPIGTLVAEFNATDPDANSTLTYHFVSGAGDGNNSLFSLESNGTLKTATTFDYETNASTYSIRVQARDEYNGTVEGNFTVTLTDVFDNQAPGAISIQFASLTENQPIGTVVGKLNAVDPEAGVVRYSLVNGVGSIGNQFFTVDVSGVLRTAVVFDFEQNASHSIRARAMDEFNGSREEVLNIQVFNQWEDPDGDGLENSNDPDDDNDGFSDIDEIAYGSDPLDSNSLPNRAPTQISLSPDRVEENMPIGTMVGQLVTTDLDDPNGIGVYQYSLPSSATGAEFFSVDSNGTIITKQELDFESNSSHTIALRVTDHLGAYLDQNITIQVVDTFIPIVETGDPVDVGFQEAILPGKLLDKGASLDPMEIGMLVSTDPNPNLNTKGIIRERGFLDAYDSFEAMMMGLEKGQKYFYRTYAINQEGVGYGVVKDFVTQEHATGPSWANAQPGAAANWWVSPWFGSFYMNDGNAWVMHSDLGWLYPMASGNKGVWLWMEQLGWLWTDEAFYPFLYQNTSAGWLYFYGAGQGTRLFYHYRDERWMQMNSVEQSD